MNAAFFGTPRFSQIVLEKLISSPFRPSFVVTAPDAKVGRGQKVGQTPVKETALKNKISVLEPQSLSGQGFLSAIGAMPFDLAILAAYGKIIPKMILALPEFGFINVHPSLLPKYRGPSPIHSAILAGEEKTGVTIMKLDAEVDHGPILGQSELKIEKDDTHDSLAEKLANLGADLLLEVLPLYLAHPRGALSRSMAHPAGVPKEQDHSKATFTQHITKQDGYIDLENPPDAVTLNRMIRAYYPWPAVWTEIGTKGQRDKVLKGIKVKFLPGGMIQPEGKRAMTTKEFLNGYPQAKEQLGKLGLL